MHSRNAGFAALAALLTSCTTPTARVNDDAGGSSSSTGTSQPMVASSSSTEAADTSSESTTTTGTGSPQTCAYEVVLHQDDLHRVSASVTCTESPCGAMRVELRQAIDDATQRVPTDEPPTAPAPIAIRHLQPDRELIITRGKTIADAIQIVSAEGAGTAERLEAFDLREVRTALASDIDDDGFEELLVGAGSLWRVAFDPLTEAYVIDRLAGPFDGDPPTPSPLNMHVSSIGVGNIDADPQTEVVVTIGNYDPLSSDAPAGPVLAYDPVDGDWQEAALYTPSLADLPASVDLGDFDGDGVDELVAITRDDRLLLLGSSEGTWTELGGIPEGVEGTPLIGDFDLDGRTELVFQRVVESNPSDRSMTILEHEGEWTSRTFSYVDYDIAVFGTWGETTEPTLIVDEGGSSNSLLRLRDTWRWEPFERNLGDALLLADVDDDGASELVEFRRAASEVWALEFNGDERLLLEGPGALEPDPWSIVDLAVADLDRDEAGNPRLCGTSRTSSCEEVVFDLAVDADAEGPWVLEAWVTDLESGCEVHSAALDLGS